MAPLSIKASREYAIFQAFSTTEKFSEALKALERYDAAHPDLRLFVSEDDKKMMRKSYKLFKEAEAVVSRHSGKPDYDDAVIVERMKTILSQRIAEVCPGAGSAHANGIATKKSIIGGMMHQYAQMMKKLDARDLQRMTREKEQVRHEPAVVGKSGITGHGSYAGDTVFSNKSGNGDKPLRQILYERDKTRA